MPGPTTKSNPWADELKKNRRKSIKGIAGNSPPPCTLEEGPSTLGETKEMKAVKKASRTSQKEKACSHETTKTSSPKQPRRRESKKVAKCVKAVENIKNRPPKVKPPALPFDEEDSRSLYQDARNQLRPVARMLSRQMSKDSKTEDETPVDRLIRQGSLDSEAATQAVEQPISQSKVAKNQEEEWGEDDEWEWEESEEEEMPKDNPIKIEKINDNNHSSSTNTNGTNMTTQNGHLTNGINMTNGKSNGHIINIEDTVIEEATGKADIQIQGNLLKIARNGPVEWSDDEYEDEEEKIPPPPPPPPPPAPPPPPPAPPMSEVDEARARKLAKIEALKKRPTQKPDWSGLMQEIEALKYGAKGYLKKTVCNDRSKPMLTANRIQGKFIFDSEQKGAEQDIFHEIKKGVRLRHVRTNDKSKPMLQGIRCFRRQTTKEERLKMGMGSTFDEGEEDEDDEDMDKLRDDLESTKQLLELEVRSKKLLEKDNKRLAQELEKLRMEFYHKGPGVPQAETPSANADNHEESVKARRNSMAAKRNSVIRLLSESESHDHPDEPEQAASSDNHFQDKLEEESEENNEEEDKKEVAALAALNNVSTNESFYEDEMAEIDEMREEVDEARKLAEEWEAKYKEMQRQMSDLESSRYKRTHSMIIDQPMQKKSSINSELEDSVDYDDGDYTWMLKREIHTLNNKLRNVRDKREIVIRERQLLQERIETLIGSIGNEVAARKSLRKEINEMNEAFKEEIREMAAEQKAAEELEECYFSDDEDLVINTHKKDELDEDDWAEGRVELDEDDGDETVDDVLQMAEEDEEDPGAALFDAPIEYDDDIIDESQIEEDDYEPTRETLNKRVERHNENVQLMRRSNFMLKGKIDRLYDILQMQKEKHHDLRQELTRMLADIQ